MKQNDDIFSNNIDYKKIFYRLYSFRKLYIATFIIFFLFAFLYNRFSTVKYKNSTIIYISNDNQNCFYGRISRMI